MEGRRGTEEGIRSRRAGLPLQLPQTQKPRLRYTKLNKAYEVWSPVMPLIKSSAHLDPLRSDPRFQDLLRRMNFPE